MDADFKSTKYNSQIGYYLYRTGHAVVHLVEAARYKLEGRGFDSIGIFH